jgi:cytidine deaminase
VEQQDRPLIDSEVQRELLDRARIAATKAYVPYSEFPVGAAVLAADGSIHTGCNVENASYGLTICAERVAATAAVSFGHRQIVAVAVSAPRVPRTTPCGACRQFLNEFRSGSSDMVVILDDRETGEPVFLEELLPQAFGPRNLDSVPHGDASSMRRPENHGG